MFFHDIIIFVFYLDPFFAFTVHIVLTKIISTNFCQYVFCRYFRRFFTSIRTRSFTLIKPFPPSGLIKHNLSTSAFGCITPHIVNNFLFFWPNHSISPFVQPIISTIYMITDTALNLIVVIMFPPLSLDLNIFLTYLIYFFLAFFCISSCFALSASKIHHCVKPVQIRSFFWSLFSRIWTEYEKRYKVPFRFQSECGKTVTRKNSVFGHISRSVRHYYPLTPNKFASLQN